MIKRKVKLTALDFFIGLFLLAVLVLLAYRVEKGIHYQWDWGVIPQYLFRFDAELEQWVPNLLIQGLLTTIRLSFWGMLLGTFVGIVIGFFRISQSLFRRLVGRTYIELLRNLPPLVIILIFYFFISDQIMPVLGIEKIVRGLPDNITKILSFGFAPPQSMSAFLSAVITLALFEGAYIAEIVRAGIESIERGQWEASRALGMTRRQLMQNVILPQAVQRILPPLSGQFISTIKDSAIVSVISIQELTFQGMELMAATYLTFEIWITISVLYLMLTLSCSLFIERIEIRFQKNR